MPDAVTRAAARATASIRMVQVSNKRALVHKYRRIGDTYNRAFAGNWEHYPLTDREVAFIVDQVYPLVDRRLMAFVAAGGDHRLRAGVSRRLGGAPAGSRPPDAVGAGAAAGRAASRLVGGAERRGGAYQYQGRGANAVLYTQIENAIRRGGFDRAELPQVAETATRMRRDLEARAPWP